MVAPTRTPQARGVKCDLCKKILAAATWLDQTKLAKEVEEAYNVLNLIKQHNTTDCPCIPKNIENLLVGSTHFEIHRLVVKKLDAIVHKRQQECYAQSKLKATNDSRKLNDILNDCQRFSRDESRFRTYSDHFDQTQIDKAKQQLKHLQIAIDFWKLALEDQTHPFNTKLALRLGLTHHVIYACYLFKYYKIIHYQLITANLLLNIFRSIEGVTINATIHSYFLLIRTLIDCDQLQLARYHLKQAIKLSNYNDKSHYESILLNCVACEVSLLEGRESSHNILDDLSALINIKPDDKLQHYYARSLAMSVILRYIHRYPSKSDHCHEFFHTFRFIGAMIRRCYESSFDMVFAEKDITWKRSKDNATKESQILDHSWIRFAICDFVFSAFELITEFYSRAGIPEYLELIYNGLALISFRNGCVYWQSRILILGAQLDLLCDKYDPAKLKLDITSRIVNHTDDNGLMNILRLQTEVASLEYINQQGNSVSKDVTDSIFTRINNFHTSLMDDLLQIELFDVKTNSFSRISNCYTNIDFIVLYGYLGKMSLRLLQVTVATSLRVHECKKIAFNIISKLGNQLESIGDRELEYNVIQIILEMLVQFTDIKKSESTLLNVVSSNRLFIEVDEGLIGIQNQLSNITLKSNSETNYFPEQTRTRSAIDKVKKNSKIQLSRRSKRKGTYEVALGSDEIVKGEPAIRLYNAVETVKYFNSLSNEEIVVSYLRNSEPNLDFNLYRRAHELMLAFRLADVHFNQDLILFHMSESVCANSMRYRLMMFEEQCSSPFDKTQLRYCSGDKLVTSAAPIKHLGFCNNLVNQNNVLKSMLRTIPEDIRLIQFKYILDEKLELEHLLCTCYGSSNEQVYIHVKKSITSDDFFNDATNMLAENRTSLSTIPHRFETKIEESRKSLLNNNHKARSELRKQIESDIGVILHDIENEWLGPFRFVLCGKISDASYDSLVQTLVVDLQAIMNDKICRSQPALKMIIQNAPILTRQEFCQALAAVYDCNPESEKPRECFSKWLRTIELHMSEHKFEMSKAAYLKQLSRNQIGIIVDQKLELIPFESLPLVRILEQGIFRIPSLRLLSIISTRRCSPIKIDPKEVAYVLDPAHNLVRTREKFECKLKNQSGWVGTIGRPPEAEQLEDWLLKKELYIFIGHGAGTVYYNKTCKGRGLSYLAPIRCAAIVMGCSSGRMSAEGPRLESFGVGWVFVFQGAPCYVGLLWDVTDQDIDKYLDALLDKWVIDKWSCTRLNMNCLSLADASSQARNVCQLKLLVGSAPVVYGLPIWCKE